MFQVYLNGRFQPLAEAQVGATDAGLLVGTGLFETLRAYERFVFRLDDHLERLFDSAKALEIPIEESWDEITRALDRAMQENALEDARCRITVTRGPMPSDHLDAPPRPTCLIVASEMTPYDEDFYAHGMTVTVSDIRVNRSDPVCRHKTTGYLTNMLALRDAHSKGAQEALRLNGPGMLAEGCVSNVFIVRDGRLVTPPVADGCLPGIARKVVLELASAAGIDCVEESIPGPDVLKAEEMFLTNSIMEVMPVCRIERHAIADEKPGAITRRLTDLYRAKVEEEKTAAEQ
jgi:branched-chain amino acid aminotransferase